VLNNEKSLQCFHTASGFCFQPSVSQAGFGLKTKTPALSRQGFFLVDKRFEISNLDLIRDIDRIIKLEEVLFIIK